MTALVSDGLFSPAGRARRRAVFLTVLGLLFLVGQAPCSAQFEARMSRTGIDAANALKASKGGDSLDDATIRLGKIGFRFSANLEQNYDDNVGLANGKQEDDFITNSGVNARASMPFSKLNTLNLSIGFGYNKHWKHSNLDGWTLATDPNQGLTYDFYVGDIHLTLYDEPNIQQDAVSQVELSNVARFKRFTNNGGVRAEWDLNLFFLTMNYNNGLFRSLEDGATFQALDSMTHTIQNRVGMRINPRLDVGVLTTFGISEYEQAQQNGSQTFSLGLFSTLLVSEVLAANASVSFQGSEFDRTGSIGDTTDFNSVVFAVGAAHQLTQWLNHSVNVSRFTTLGIGSNFTDIYALGYTVKAEVLRDVSTNLSFDYRDFSTSSLVAHDEGYQYTVTPTLGYLFMKDTTASLSYSHVAKGASLPQGDYEGNSVQIKVSRQF